MEDVLSNIRESRGNLVTISIFCDAAFTNDLVARM